VPLYPYICPAHGSFEVVQDWHGDHESHPCPVCQSVSPRVWSPPMVAVDNTGGFNAGLGCVVRNKSHIRDIQRKYHDDTGSNLIEMGNETSYRAQKPRVHYPTAQEIGY